MPSLARRRPSWSLSRLTLLGASAWLFACSAGAPASEAPRASATADASASAAPVGDEQPAPSPQPSQPSKPSKPTSGDYVPDDYLITEGDCAQLGTQYARAITADESAKVSAKLSEKQRETTLARIEEVAEKMASDWKKGCRASLVGKAVERKALACALEARSVAQFDKCLNG